MNIVELTIRNKLLSSIAIVLIIAGGISAYLDMPRFEDPEFTIRVAQVFTAYPGASPEEVATEVTEPLERAIQELQEVKEIVSTSSDGVSELQVEIKFEFSRNKADLQVVWTKLRNKIDDASKSLPPGAQAPMVYDDFGDVYGLYYYITGPGYSAAELRQYAKDLQRELLQVNGVAKVVLAGEQQEAIFVEISRETAVSLGISQQRIYDILSQQNAVVSAGDVLVGGQRIVIDPSGEIDSVEAIRNLLVTTANDGRIITLSDIARVWRGYETPPASVFLRNGEPAIAIGIAGQLGGNISKVGAAVSEKIAESESRRPIGIELHEVYHQGEAVDTSVNDFVMNVLAALVIVIVTLLVFMGRKSAKVIGSILLLTVLFTLAAMNLFGIPMHRISLGALIIALGMMVDNAIVVTEGILVGVRKGEDKLAVAKRIVGQVKWPLLGGTLVGIIAFAPIGLSEGEVAEFTGHLFWVVLISLLASWVFAITLTPLFCHWLFNDDDKATESNDQPNIIYRAYGTTLRIALKHRTWVVIAAVAIFVVSMWGFQFVKPGFFPGSTTPQMVVDYWLPQGTDIETTLEDVREIEAFVRGQQGVESTASSVGSGGIRYMLVYSPESPNSSYGQIIVRLEDHRLNDTLIPTVQDFIDQRFPEAQAKVWRFMMGPGGGSKVEATFKGPDPAVLRDLAEQAKAIMVADGGALSIKDSWRQIVPVIEPVYSAAAGRQTGVSREDLANALRTNYSGDTVGYYREGDDLIPIVSRAPANERRDVANIEDIQVLSSATGQVVPITQVTEGFRTAWRNAILKRENRNWTIKAQSDPYPGELPSDLLGRVRPLIEAIELPDGYTLEWDGEFGDSAEANEKLMSTIPLGFMAMVLTVIALFRALRQPAAIWALVPLALIGVVFGLVVTGLPLEFMGILGLLSLSGLLIKNGIVLVDQVDLEIREGKPRFDAVIEASTSRLRPVMMGALTTVLGVVPLFMDAFFRSMSVVLVFGLSFATLLTLVILPTIYTLMFGITPTESRHAIHSAAGSRAQEH